jgi:hypothetical protein
LTSRAVPLTCRELSSESRVECHAPRPANRLMIEDTNAVGGSLGRENDARAIGAKKRLAFVIAHLGPG